MTTYELLQIATELEKEIVGAGDERRISLQPQFAAVLHRMAEAGAPVPPNLKSLDSALLEEVIEHRFDNMPV